MPTYVCKIGSDSVVAVTFAAKSEGMGSNLGKWSINLNIKLQ